MLIRVPLLLLATFGLVCVGRPALVRIAVPTTASGVVLGRVVMRDAIGEVLGRLVNLASRVTGAGTIDVACAAAAGRIL